MQMGWEGQVPFQQAGSTVGQGQVLESNMLLPLSTPPPPPHRYSVKLAGGRTAVPGGGWFKI